MITAGYVHKENESTSLKRFMHPNVHSSIIYNSQDSPAKCPPTDECIKKMWYVHIHKGILLSHKKSEFYHLQPCEWT